MTDERYTFEQAKIRLEEIATLVRKKDTSLEKSLDLLEEVVRLANICTELVDHTDLSATASGPEEAATVRGGEGVDDAKSVGGADDAGGADRPADADDNPVNDDEEEGSAQPDD